jgi:hypothetical protein
MSCGEELAIEAKVCPRATQDATQHLVLKVRQNREGPDEVECHAEPHGREVARQEQRRILVHQPRVRQLLACLRQRDLPCFRPVVMPLQQKIDDRYAAAQRSAADLQQIMMRLETPLLQEPDLIVALQAPDLSVAYRPRKRVAPLLRSCEEI